MASQLIKVLVSLVFLLASVAASAQESEKPSPLSVGISDAFHYGVFGRSVMQNILSPRVDLRYGPLELAFVWRDTGIEQGQENMTSSGFLSGELALTKSTGWFAPAVGLGIAGAWYRKDVSGRDFSSVFFVLAPLRFHISPGFGTLASIDVEISALELRYGTLLPLGRPDIYDRGSLFLSVDLLRLGPRFRLD
ncbi:MAG: hypothetical protein WCQ50_18195 [Spirochaetota bacterium]